MSSQNRKWIKDLYERSWEMELLISGFALVLMVQALDQVGNAYHWVAYHIVIDDYLKLASSLFLVALFAMSLFVLVSFLSLNLVFRAYWVALIGLLSAREPGLGRFEFSRFRRQNLLQNRQLRQSEQHLIKVDKVGSQLFSVALLYVCYIASVVLLVLESASLTHGLTLLGAGALAKYTVYLFDVLALLFLADVFSGGLFSNSRFHWVSRAFYPIYRAFRLLSGYAFYEHVVLNMRRNRNQRLITGAFFLMLAGVIAFRGLLAGGAFYHGTETVKLNKEDFFGFSAGYAPKAGSKGLVFQTLIDQQRYQSMPVTLFVPMTASLNGQLEKACAKRPQSPEDANCINKVLTVSLDGQPVPLDWHFHRHQPSGTKGIQAYLDRPDLARGRHLLGFQYHFLDKPLELPFWYFPK
ncbi:hypothetical protein [Gallaecimonas sp. GXIMD4217]|uniref:hypothetical protein n=1 Tax=Gallaecimonas sp. GXIMD4217 TaxID=3131927 RepID=UPI00311B0921